MITIYSIGDINYLEVILNALAALFERDSSNTFKHLGYLFAIAFLVGIVFSFLKGILMGCRLRLLDFMIGFLLFWTMFIPTKRVVIEDLYTGSVKAVDNVPLGPAMVGGALSQIGYRITQLFEQAYTIPNAMPMTQGRFADPLTTLTKVRKRLMSRIEQGKANSPTPGADMERSWANYIKDCTLTGVDLGLKSMDDVLRDPDVLSGLTFNHNAYGTRIYIGPIPQDLTCAEATTQLRNYSKGAWLTALQNKIAQDFGVLPGDIPAKIGDALNALSLGTVQWQDYVMAAALIPALEKGIAGRHMDSMHYTVAAMVEQAVQQRNTQWAAQASLFERYVRPMLTFIEGFSYAIVPLVAFAICMGPIGFRTAAMYLALNFWIQLWMPVLSIVNLFIQMTTQNEMATLASLQYQFPSFIGVYKADFLLQDWLSVGGLLASSAPALSFMLVSGSAVAMTHMVSRLEGSDTIDETLVSPGVARNSPAMINAQRYVQDPTRGFRMYGAEQNLPSINIGDVYNELVSHSRQRAQEAIDAFTHQASLATGSAASLSSSATDANTFHRSLSASKSAVDAYVRDTANSVVQSMGWNTKDGSSQSRYAAVEAAVSGALRGIFNKNYGDTPPETLPEPGQAGTPGGEEKNASDAGLKEAIKRFLKKHGSGGLNAGASGGIRWSANLTEEEVERLATEVAERFSDTKTVAAELAERVNTDAQRGVSQSVSMGWDAREIQQLSKSAQDVIRTGEAWRKEESLRGVYGASGTFNVLNIAQSIREKPALQDRLNNYMAVMGLKQDAADLGHQLSLNYGLGKDEAYIAAGVMLMTGYQSPRYRNLGKDERLRMMSIGYSLVGEAMHTDGGIGSPNLHEAQGVGIHGFGEAKSQVEDAGVDVKTDVREQSDAIKRKAASGMSWRPNEDQIRKESEKFRENARDEGFKHGSEVLIHWGETRDDIRRKRD